VAKKDYYDILGINKSASKDEIKKAYRTTAFKYHPDKNPGDKAAEEKFKEASEAYSVLSDDKKKANYDQFGHAVFEGGGGGGGFSGFDTSSFSDIFEDFFSDFTGSSSRGSGRRTSGNRGNDLRYDVSISLEDAYKGLDKKILYTTYKKCNSCKGSGAEPGSKPVECDYCDGRGKVRSNQGFFTVQQTCPQCDGYGETISKACSICRGNGKVQSEENVSVKIPKGVDDGTRIRLAGKGEAGSKAAGNGDLYLFISVQNHSLFKRSEENLFFELPIGFADAALGTTIEVPCIDGSKVKVKIPAGTQYGKQLRLKEKGMPILKRSSYGDLYIRIIPEVPVSLTKRQKEILEEFKELENTKISPTIKSFFEKAKKFWSSN
jgi:molecular chaperone DnaJ